MKKKFYDETNISSKIGQLYLSGLKEEKIAKELKISLNHVCRITKGLSIPSTYQKTELNKAKKNKKGRYP